MFLNSSTSLVPPNNSNNNNNNNDKQYLYPAYSCDHLLVPPLCYSRYKSTPNVAFRFDNQNEHRRLSDGPFLPSLRHPFPYNYYHHPGEFVGVEGCMLKRKNSSLNMLLDSTSSIMRTASSTFQCLIGSARRASYCGQPDPSVHLAPNGNSGSLYLRSTTADSNESSLSNVSYDEKRRTVTIYDGRIPQTPITPMIPFELMTPIEVITHASDDPIESFVQIVLEAPDDRPPIMLPMTSSPTHMSSSPLRRHRSSSPKLKPINQRPTTSLENTTLPKLTQHKSMPTTELFNSTQIHCQPLDVFEPMDFSFLEPVLRGESAAPPPRPPVRNPSLSLLNNNSRQISQQNSPTTEESAVDFRTPSHSSYLSNRTTAMEDDLTSPESSSDDNYNYYAPPPPRLNIRPSIE